MNGCNCCIAGATPTPDISDPCVCNAGKGAVFVGTTGQVYLRTGLTNPCATGDWELLGFPPHTAHSDQAAAETFSVPAGTSGQPSEDGLVFDDFYTINNPSDVRPLAVMLVVTANTVVTTGDGSNIVYGMEVSGTGQGGAFSVVVEASSSLSTRDVFVLVAPVAFVVPAGGEVEVRATLEYHIVSGSVSTGSSRLNRAVVGSTV